MSKGDRERPTNHKRYGENMDRMYGQWCRKHRRHKCEVCAPKFAIGERVYVRELDVFGIVRSVSPLSGEYEVQCEYPMPSYVWTGDVRWLEPANK